VDKSIRKFQISCNKVLGVDTRSVNGHDTQLHR